LDYYLPSVKYPPLAKPKQAWNTHPWPLQTDTIQFHTCPLPLLWHEFDNSLWYFLQSKVSFCLHMYFLWRHPLPPNKWGNYQDIVTLIDSRIVLTYDCWHLAIFDILMTVASQSPIFQWVMLWKWQYIFITQPMSCFLFHFLNLLLKILFTQPFSLRCHPPP
jgi:hypothetical protein